MSVVRMNDYRSDAKAINEGWSRTIGSDHRPEVWASWLFQAIVSPDPHYSGQVEIPADMLKGRSPHVYAGWYFEESGTFVALPWQPLRAWIDSARRDPRFAREFAWSKRGGLLMPVDLAFKLISGQMTIGRDEYGGVFKAGLSLLEGKMR